MAGAAIATAQSDLFGSADLLPAGLRFEPAFIDAADEEVLIAAARAAPLRHAHYKEYTARRRVFAWGRRFDFVRGVLREGTIAPGADLDDAADAPALATAAGPDHATPGTTAGAEVRADSDAAPVLPAVLQALRARLAAWAGVAPEAFVHVMVSEYAPGTPLGWHRDAPGYELIVGVSLGGPARLRFRPWPHRAPLAATAVATAPGDAAASPFALELAPRSVYAIGGAARWGWQHSVPPVPELRYSITMRTARASWAARAAGGTR